MQKTTLGLDVGTASIGWALVDENTAQLVATGVRVFPEGVDRDQQGGEKSKTQTRRDARGGRRQLLRRRRRKGRLGDLLTEAGLLPADRGELEELLGQNPYSLRARALDLFDDLPPDATGEARGVNDDGVVIGIVDGEQRSFIWQDGVLTETINGLGGEGVSVQALNNRGLIVGRAHDGLAFSYDMKTGVMRALGDGTAKAVNDRGVAVGDKTIDFSGEHASRYEHGEEIDMHEFFPLYMSSSDAEGINNYGWIVGWGDDDQFRMDGRLLVPLYERGDYDGDTDVDHQDFQHFQRCFAADPFPDGTLHVGCSVFDFDDDVDLDLDDYAAFQSAFTGPTAPNNNPNGPG